MASTSKSTGPSYLYLGLAGETGPGRVVDSGLFRLADGGNEWEALQRGLPEKPAVRALAVHPLKPEIIYAGTQFGPYRSADRGEHWEKVELPDHGLPVWSILFHPHDPDVILVGCDNCEIYRSDDAGEHWTRLPVSVRFPEITTAPGANPAKRVLMLDASASEPDHLYGAIEVGGTIRSTDGGEHWENLSHGQYINDDMVDMHGVLASRWRPGTVFGIARAGMWRSADGGDHWSHVPLEPLNVKGQIYCRDIREVPGNPRHLWMRRRLRLHQRSRHPAAQPRWRRQLDAGRCRRPGAAHDVQGRLRRAPAEPHVVRHQWRRGLDQPRRRRELDAAAATARRHAGLRPGSRLTPSPGRRDQARPCRVRACIGAGGGSGRGIGIGGGGSEIGGGLSGSGGGTGGLPGGGRWLRPLATQ